MDGWLPTAVGEQFLVGTAGILQRVGKDGQSLEGLFVVDGPGQGWNDPVAPGEPARIDGHGTRRRAHPSASTSLASSLAVRRSCSIRLRSSSFMPRRCILLPSSKTTTGPSSSLDSTRSNRATGHLRSTNNQRKTYSTVSPLRRALDAPEQHERDDHPKHRDQEQQGQEDDQRPVPASFKRDQPQAEENKPKADQAATQRQELDDLPVVPVVHEVALAVACTGTAITCPAGRVVTSRLQRVRRARKPPAGRKPGDGDSPVRCCVASGADERDGGGLPLLVRP